MNAPRSAQPLLVVLDAQQVFLRQTPWHVPHFHKVLPQLEWLVHRFAGRTICSRHVPPPDGGHGSWRAFYRAWAELERDPALWDLVPGLAAAQPCVVTKSVYSCFGALAFVEELERRGNPPLLVAGIETDCCVLATVLDAVDAGIPVTVIEDAVASPDAVAHAGALALFRRLPHQVRVSATREIDPTTPPADSN